MKGLLSLYIFILHCLPVFSQLNKISTDTIISVSYNSGKYIPDEPETHQLFQFLDALSWHVIVINSHTDTVGSIADNIKLSRNRSEYMKALLIGRYRYQDKLSMLDSGELNPKSATNNAVNRRVDIQLRYTPVMEKINDQGVGSEVVRSIYLDKLFFEPDLPVITPSSLSYLETVAGILKSYHEEKFEIRGHVNWVHSKTRENDSGYRKKMTELSIARAKTVCQMLVDRGIPAQRMRYMGLANKEMLFPDPKNEDEQRQNMRVEIVIIREK